MRKALVVLSGGQDSTTVLFWARREFDEVHAVTFDYGQRHAIEIEAAKRVAELAGVASHEIIVMKDCLKSVSPLTSNNELEQYKSFEEMENIIGNRVELTFVPMRNTLFMTIAANRAVALDCLDLVTGVCEEDNANYPDCRLSFINALETTFQESLGLLMQIHTPLMHLNKAATVNLAASLGDDCWNALAYTHTAYDGQYPPLGNDHATLLRANGFLEAGLPDPLILRAVGEGLMDLPETSNYQIGTKVIA